MQSNNRDILTPREPKVISPEGGPAAHLLPVARGNIFFQYRSDWCWIRTEEGEVIHNSSTLRFWNFCIFWFVFLFSWALGICLVTGWCFLRRRRWRRRLVIYNALESATLLEVYAWRNVVTLTLENLTSAGWKKSKKLLLRYLPFYTEMKCEIPCGVRSFFRITYKHISLLIFPNPNFQQDKEDDACLTTLVTPTYLIRRPTNAITLLVNPLLPMILPGC